MMQSYNPATDAVLVDYVAHDELAIESRLRVARAAQQSWARLAVRQRTPYLLQAAAVLRRRKDALARIITLEMGKPLSESVGEIEKCAWNLEYYAQQGETFLADQVIASAAADSRIVYDPLGLVLAVMPWNYPFWQVVRAAAPVLVGGNGMVLKHASNVPQCALALEQVFAEAGFPQGLFTTLLVDASAVPRLIRDERISAVTFTGSTPVGRSIASLAGQALKKQVLELGGSDPFVVLADADVEAAAAVAVKARFSNTGQSCISSKRFIVELAIADRFAEAFVAGARKLVVGDPLQAGTTIGSMARRKLRDELHAQVLASIQEGAQVLIGGRPIDGPGAFYEPTILDHVTPGMTAAREETFGPAAAILRVASVDEAITVANDSPFGLGAALWTGDLDRASQLVRRIDAGAVFVNGMVASDPRLPFGGTKQSGYGRELGHLGLHEFMNIKTVWTGPAKT
jgi:succinate-semialdehyde dehydrogenase/glutarate-semialdehyde dehydrogenase